MSLSTPVSGMPEDQFVDRFGGVYEHSPWIATQAWESGLNQGHDTLDGLAALLAAIVDAAPTEQQRALINAHPDLAGKAAQAGELTEESSSEQAGAGIDQCSAEEFARFQHFNRAYREKFNFPFIMAVKGANRHQILASFEQRLRNDEQTEFQQALQQIHRIARFRLTDIFS